ncbi:B12-binding domain-containing radical SAM protein [uncultured Robinsoniella sp.]|uniref:B12-binding domain-containing radical SAM protein n=1 Tax=uncultured Robinsoniella sp. TaxID=904190 RepID=UPI00374F8273
MKLLLTAINAKYIHSNLAVYSLRAFAREFEEHIEIAEYTINHYTDDILQDIYKKKPDVIAFSCYIWNLEFVKILIEDLAKVLPDTRIWAGGPEVSFDAVTFLEAYPQVSGVMTGEGEQTFYDLSGYYVRGGELGNVRGITYRNDRNEIVQNPCNPVMDMDTLPFMYGDMKDFTNKIVYYESSRGCPFSCSYCLSSIDKKLRFRSLSLVEAELQFFLDHQVPQVKFVDRTFNCNHRHAQGIWNYIREHDNGITNFHFEIAADLLNEEELQLLGTLRPGLVQLEIGVQSTNMETIQEIDRVMDFESLKHIVARIHEGKNIHQHLDLIAGLPYEDYDRFIQSFNDVYALRPDQFQLGFLKVLKGSKMHQNAAQYGIAYKSRPQYEVLSTKWLSYEEVLKLKAVEEMVEVYYNSLQFAHTVRFLERAFGSAYEMFEQLADYYDRKGLGGMKHSRMSRIDHLRSFAVEQDEKNAAIYDELLLLDLYLRENSKSRPSWASDPGDHKERIYSFYKKEAENPACLKGYEGYNYKQLSKMTHFEVFHHQVLDQLQEGCFGVVFDYRSRNPLSDDAAVTVIDFGSVHKV